MLSSPFERLFYTRFSISADLVANVRRSGVLVANVQIGDNLSSITLSARLPIPCLSVRLYPASQLAS